MRITQAILDAIETDIQGSCQDLTRVMEYHVEEAGIPFDTLTLKEELAIIDYVEERHFLCIQCGWWSETGDWDETKATADGDMCTACGDSD